MASRHWTFRVLKYAGSYSGATLRVYKDSHARAYMPVEGNQHRINVGSLWMQDNFPHSYAGFLSFLAKGHTSRWHSQGFIDCSAHDKGEILSPEMQEFRFAKSQDRAEQKETNRIRKERELLAWALANNLITPIEAMEKLGIDSNSVTKMQALKKINM